MSDEMRAAATARLVWMRETDLAIEGPKMKAAIEKRDRLVRKLRQYKIDLALKEDRIAKAEALFAAKSKAEALEQPTDIELPDANEIEKLRADVRVGKDVGDELQLMVDLAEKAVNQQQQSFDEAASNHVKVYHLTPALAELESAFASVRSAAARVMAAHHVAYWKHARKNRVPLGLDDSYGPAFAFLRHVQQEYHLWDRDVYKILPKWMPTGYYNPADSHGVDELEKQLLGEIAELAS